MSICVVTAFLDIGRDKWNHFNRTVETYISHFLPYLKLEHELIIFIDDRYQKILERICKNRNLIQIIPINTEWLKKHSKAFPNLEREREIMNSGSFRNLIQHRIHHPECSKPEYNIATHCKTDYLDYVITNNLSSAEYLAWSDFGLFKYQEAIPKIMKLDIEKFDRERININGVNPISEEDFDIFYTLVNAPEKIAGGFLLGNRKNLLKYISLYRKVCEEFYSMEIVDDDQHVIVQCIAREPDLFHVWNIGWCRAYISFGV